MATKKKRRAKAGPSRQRRFSHELKLRAVKLYLEEGYAAAMVAEELGIGHSTLTAWVKRYREEGEGGFGRRCGARAGRRWTRWPRPRRSS